MILADCSCTHKQPTQEVHQTVSHQYKVIDTEGLKNLLSTNVPVVVLDARTGEWDDGDRIAHAQLLSYEASAEEVANIVPHKDDLVVVYCTNLSCPAGKMLAEHLLALGYTNVVKYAEGIEQWKASGNEIVSVK